MNGSIRKLQPMNVIARQRLRPAVRLRGPPRTDLKDRFCERDKLLQFFVRIPLELTACAGRS